MLVRAGAEALLLDAGTGVRRLLTDARLRRGVDSLDVVLTHFHLDHVAGLHALAALTQAGDLARRPKIWAPGRWLFGSTSAELLAPLLRPPISPFPPHAFAEVLELRGGEQRIGRFVVAALDQPRHWGPTAALRVNDALALITDTGSDPRHAAFASGVDHLLHEAWSTSDEPSMPERDATAADAGRTAAQAGVKHLTLIHLHPLLRDERRLLVDARSFFPGARLGVDSMALSPAG